MLDWLMHDCACIPLTMNHSTGLPFLKRRLPWSRLTLDLNPVFRSKPSLHLLAALVLGSAWVTAPAAALEAGFAKAEITPVLGTPLAGRLERWGRGSETIHDPQNVRCLYLEDGETSIFLVSADLYAVLPELRARVLELAPQVAPPEHVVIAATHTHSGPGGMDRRVVRRVYSGRSSPRVLEETAQQIAACMRDAYTAQRRAAIGHAAATWSPPEALTDVNAAPSTIRVLRVEDSDGVPIAIVVTASLMPDNVGMDELLTLSSDFPGYLCKSIDDTLGTEGGALFFNGASGDFVRGDMPASTSWAAIEALGHSLGERALEVSDAIECGELPVSVRSAVEPMPMSLGDAWLPHEVLITQYTVGDLTLTFVPFGISPDVFTSVPADQGAENRSEFIGYANGFAGHIVSEANYAGDTAAARLHYYGPTMAGALDARIQSLVGDAEPDSVEEAPASGEPVEEAEGFFVLTTTDRSPDLRGNALAGVARDSYERRIHEPAAAGTLLPGNDALAHVPWFVDASPVALLQLAFELRPAWAALDTNQRVALQRYADGAELPLEAAWLLQHEDAVLGYVGLAPDDSIADRSLMFAVHGDKAGAEGLLTGIRIPWVYPETPLIHRTVSSTGMSVISLTPAYAMGAIAGMNGAGVVVCAVRNGEGGPPRLASPPLAMQLERALGLAQNADSLMQELAATASLDGYDLFVADTGTETAAIVHGAAEPNSPSPLRGLIMDRLPQATPLASGRDAPRRLLVEFMKSAERIVSADELEAFATDLAAPNSPDAPTEQFVSILFEPKAKRIRARFEGNDAASEGYVQFALEAGNP